MNTFVLIHGSWHGGWCWDKIVPLLERGGHTVLAPNLAGLGADSTPVKEVTLETWTRQIGDLVALQAEPVVLVAHSRGGIVASQVAEAHPDRVSMLIYLAAFLLRDGESLIQLAQTDTESLTLANLIVDQEQGVHTVQPGSERAIFYNDCSDDDAAWATRLLRPEPNAPTFTQLHLTDERFGRVPRCYITCRRDQAVGPSIQDRMVAALPCAHVVSLNTGHSPFLSAPEDLADHLTDLAPAASRVEAVAHGDRVAH